MDECKTREDFNLLLKKQFEFVAKAAAKSVEPEIKRFGLDAELLKQIQGEQMALPEWALFVQVLEKTPEGAARIITDLIILDNENREIDWQEQWKEAFLASFNPWRRREWKYFGHVAAQTKGFIAEAKIMAYNAAIAKPEFDDVDAIRIEDIGLSTRAYNCLKAAKVGTVGQARRLRLKDAERMWGVGRGAIKEIQAVLKKMGIDWPNNNER